MCHGGAIRAATVMERPR
ncbi:MAG: hypothetical protein EXQ56_12540 [Acidobacteria bacterium]|nr:hypothetical protein [Acidobacteriota bacterium]